MSEIARVTMAVPKPPGPDAITVYDVEDEIPAGVPEILPVIVSKDNPIGRAGLTWYKLTGPPEEIMAFTAMATCLT